MSYTEDAVRAKLSALNETQESIVTVAQWVMFHRRYADKTAQLWLERMKESNPSKRVNLIYLANEVAQQSKARRKDDFLNAFSPIMPEATAVAFKGATNDVQIKVKRVVEVWRQRQIFDPAVQEAIEARVAEAEKQRPAASRKALGGSLFSSESSIPVEVQPLVTAQQSLSKIHLNMAPLVQTTQKDHTALMSSAESSRPPARVYAAQLGALVKALANAEATVSESLGKRRELILGLEKLMEKNRLALAEEEITHTLLTSQRVETEARRRAAEDSIMPGLSTAELGDNGSHSVSERVGTEYVERPELERFTPPPIEPLLPPLALIQEATSLPIVVAAEVDQVRSTTPDGPPPPSLTDYQSQPDKNGTTVWRADSVAPYPLPDGESLQGASMASTDTQRRKSLDTFATAAANAIPPTLTPVNGTKVAGSPDLSSDRGNKRRKRSGDDFERIGFGVGEDALEGLDEEVVGMLG